MNTTKILGIVLISILSSAYIASASIDKNLKYGQRDNEVMELQEFLVDKGFLKTIPTNFFGLLTLKAVKAYQTSVSVSPTGFVGVLTREKINNEIAVEVASSNEAEIKETGIVAQTTTAIVDVCKNIEGIQTNAPSGMFLDNLGNCFTPAVSSSPINSVNNSNTLVVSNTQSNIATKPLTGIMTYHPNLLNNAQTKFMISLKQQDQCSNTPNCLIIKTKPAYSSDYSWESYGQLIDGIEFNFQDTLDTLTEENYKQHGWKQGEKVMIKSFSANIGDFNAEEISDVKFIANGKVIPVERNYNMFTFSGNIEMTGSINVYGKINPSASGKKLQVTFTSLELVGQTTKLPITLPFSMPQVGRNYDLIIN